MIIKSNTLSTIVDDGVVIGIDGIIEVMMEPVDMELIREFELFDSKNIGRYIAMRRLRRDIFVPMAEIESFTVESMDAAPWPKLCVALRVKDFDAYAEIGR